MTTMQTTKIWEPQQLNSSGIRRVKILLGDSVDILPIGDFTNKVSLIPKSDAVLYEFVFPSDMSCVASWTSGRKESGAAFWIQSLSFSLPHIQDQVLMWAHANAAYPWLVITEAYNGAVRMLGGSPGGLMMGFSAASGGGPKDANPMQLSFTAEQFCPFLTLAGYEDTALFATDAGFTTGFSVGFES